MKLKILGPPGTGKTTCLLQYLEKEIQNGTPPNRISFLTFTRAARVEALQRTNKADNDFPYLKTIHSICYRQLAIGRDQIVRPENIRKFGNQLGIKLTGNDFDPWIEEFTRGIDAPTRDDVLLQANHCGRHRKLQLKDTLQGLSTEVDFKYARWFTNAYRAWKEANGMLDYTDLLTRYIEYGKSLDIDTIFVDEAQDLSALQWDAVERLGANAKRWYIAGDDDQAIFHWAGADSNAFQDLAVDKVEVLHQSYRLSKAVHHAALEIAQRIRKRLPKEYNPTESEGLVANAGYLGSVDLDQKSFILFRNHYRGSDISQLLRNESIPYIGRGSPFNDLDVRRALGAWFQLFEHGEAKSEDVKKLLHFCDHDYIAPEVYGLIKEHKSVSIKDTFFEIPKIERWFQLLDIPNKEDMAAYIRKRGFLRCALPKVELMSIHQSKGREAHTVLIDPEMSRAVWEGMIRNPDDEHRCWYVAVSRAKERVFFLLPDGNFSYRF
jgi:DNA helicase-2/ATP-dependent DNA helicase PcrA